MQQLTKLALTGALLVGATAAVTAKVVRAQQGGDMDMAAMMEQMMKLATPGEEHKHLAEMVGEWEQSYRMRMAPDAEWMETKGSSKTRTLLGGRYIMDEIEFDMMGMPMQGLHIIGYDNMHGEYISFWADSMSTWWVTGRGKADEDGTVTTTGTMVDIAGERPFKMVIRHGADGAVVTEMYDTIPPHGEVQVMEVTSRKK